MSFHCNPAQQTPVEIMHSYPPELDHPSPCFRQLFTILQRLPQEDLSQLCENYINNYTAEATKFLIVDALGAAHTNDTWTALTEQVLRAKQPDAELILRGLLAFVAIDDPPPQVISIFIVYMMFKKFIIQSPTSSDIYS